jgi:hypothetical protein
MTHRFEIAAPTVPGDAAIASDGAREVTLTWSPAEGTASDPVRGYAIFRRQGEAPDPERPDDLHATLGATRTSYAETFDTPPDPPVYYRVVAVSQLGGRSAATDALSTASLPLPAEDVPSARTLHVAAYPNPTSGAVAVRYRLPEAMRARLVVYDLLGRRVALLAEGLHAAGAHEATWRPAELASGTYFCRLETQGVRQRTVPLVLR